MTGNTAARSADRLVSEAFYLDGTEGSGVELHFDRPSDT